MAREMTFDEAVSYVKRTNNNAFAFVPDVRNGRTKGGELWVLECDEEFAQHPEDFFEYVLHYQSGDFFSSTAEEGTYDPDDIPVEARALKYRATKTPASGLLFMELQLALEALEGGVIEEA